MDRTRKYVLQNSNDQSRENMSYSVDTCSHLALLSNGSIFDSSSLSLKKVRHQKMAIDTISNRIAKSSLPSQCQVCTCEADETGAAKSVCRSCYSEMTDVSIYFINVIYISLSLSLLGKMTFKLVLDRKIQILQQNLCKSLISKSILIYTRFAVLTIVT